MISLDGTFGRSQSRSLFLVTFRSLYGQVNSCSALLSCRPIYTIAAGILLVIMMEFDTIEAGGPRRAISTAPHQFLTVAAAGASQRLRFAARLLTLPARLHRGDI